MTLEQLRIFVAVAEREHMTEATSLYNLLRNLGGSVGIAFTTTMLARRAQLHQTRLVENLSPFDPSYQAARERIGELLDQDAAS